jgi:hypothetical protein
MDRHSGIRNVNYDNVFFQWLRNQLIMVEEIMVEYYAYLGNNFHGDLDLALPEGS